jgi:hypothetical protein
MFAMPESAWLTTYPRDSWPTQQFWWADEPNWERVRISEKMELRSEKRPKMEAQK